MNGNIVNPDQLASSEASWSGSTLFIKKVKNFEFTVFFLGSNIVCHDNPLWKQQESVFAICHKVIFKRAS